MIKIRTFLISLTLCLATTVNAQRHFYHRIDVGSSNIYTFVISNLITGYANYLTHDILFDNSYVYTIYGGKVDGESVNTQGLNPMGITASELFNDTFIGIKLGYKSNLMGAFNWGVYASGHYRVNQFKEKLATAEDYTKERFNYFKPGVGILLTFGGIESKVKVELEAAARYDIPVGYKGLWGSNSTNVLGEGISSHYSIKVGGYSWFSGGIFVDLCHYKPYNNTQNISSFKPYSFGVTFTITPKRGEDLYD
ncbi:MAG: hypothetical protein Q4D41_00450 [Prevotellaceae bacterium]|nr:hypothetical protein [Prevotellaceae bacterium]